MSKRLIYAEDVIDALRACQTYKFDPLDDRKITLVDAEDAIEALPSVQPDGIPLEWIDKHLEWLDNCDNDFAQLAKVSIRAMVEIWKKDKT